MTAAIDAGAEDDALDPTADWRRQVAERLADLDDARIELRADTRKFANQWRREALVQRRMGNSRQHWLYVSAADALEGWADKIFSPTTVWPGL